jgi:hypothetical protein
MSRAGGRHSKRRLSAASKEKADNDRSGRNMSKHHMDSQARHFERGYSNHSMDAERLWHAVVKARRPRGSLAYWRKCSKRAQERLSGRQEAGMGLCKSKTKPKRKPKPNSSKKPAAKRKSRIPEPKNNRRHVPLTEHVLQVGVASMKAAVKANRESIAATARLLQEATHLQNAKNKALAQVEKARQHTADVQEAIETAPVVTERLLAREERAQLGEEKAVEQLQDVTAENNAVLREVAAAQKRIAPAQYEIIDMVIYAPAPNDRPFALAKCLTTDTLQAYYRSQSGVLWHLARMTRGGQMIKSDSHYSGGLVASWAMQNLLNAALAKGPRLVAYEEFQTTDVYRVMMRPVYYGDHVVSELLENSCFSAPHPLLQLLNNTFPCPLQHKDLWTFSGETALRSNVRQLVDDLFTKQEATRMSDSLHEKVTQKQMYTIIRDVLDAYMRKHFKLSPNTAQTQVVAAFDTTFMQNVSVVKRIIESKTDATARFNVFIAVYQIRDAPSHLQGRTFEQVLLIQRKGHVDDALAKLADSYGVLYCFAPAGQLTCKPLEYIQQTIGKKNKENRTEVTSRGGYNFVGEFLAGVFPASTRE